MTIREKIFLFLCSSMLCCSIFAITPDSYKKSPISTARFTAIEIISTKEIITNTGLTRYFSTLKNRSVAILSTKTTKDFTATAIATDNERYLVNEFLLGFNPYNVDNVWQIMDQMRRFTFRADRSVLNKKDDVWLTSKEFFTYRIGDCEDHAILLADWMIENNWDAKLVIGTLNEVGHAWVLLTVNKKDYILDSTIKSLFNQYRQFPLAKHKPEYKPQYMFDRKDFWSYEDKLDDRKYNKNNWIYKSKIL